MLSPLESSASLFFFPDPFYSNEWFTCCFEWGSQHGESHFCLHELSLNSNILGSGESQPVSFSMTSWLEKLFWQQSCFLMRSHERKASCFYMCRNDYCGCEHGTPVFNDSWFHVVCGMSSNDTSIHPGAHVLCLVIQSETVQYLTCAFSCLPALLSGDCECRLKIAGVSALLLLVWDIFLPAFVLATCCWAGLLLKAEMLAGYGLCIIDAECDWALQAIGYNFKKSKKVVNSGWTHMVFSRIRRRWRLLKPRVEWRPDSGDITSLLVHF